MRAIFSNRQKTDELRHGGLGCGPSGDTRRESGAGARAFVRLRKSVHRRVEVARLPHPIREQINRRLQNGQQGKRIVQWLNTLPEVQAVRAAEFNGQPINATNLTHWKNGGYRDWQEREEVVAAVGRFGGSAAELTQASGGALTDQLAVCLAARIAVALRESASTGVDPARQLHQLRQLCANLVQLRRGDHTAQRLKLGREQLELDRKKQAEEIALRERLLKLVGETK